MFNYLCNNDDKTYQVLISLCEGGIGFQSPNPISDGHFIAMHMELDELLSISCFGEVVSCEAINPLRLVYGSSIYLRKTSNSSQNLYYRPTPNSAG
jgi:hypothetical protein